MKYLSRDEVLVYHARIIDETGGSHGVRDLNLLYSLIERPKMKFGGKDLYTSVFDKAAAYFESCAFHHIFTDGNKRTAIAVSVSFLVLNGYEFNATNKEVVDFVLSAVKNKYTIKKVSAWIKNNSKKHSDEE